MIKTHKFDFIISKCTQMDPSRRYHSAKKLKVALMRLMEMDLAIEAEQASVTSLSDITTLASSGYFPHAEAIIKSCEL